MTRLKSTLVKGVLTAAIAAGALAATSTAASAYTACNRFGECWRVHDRYTNYPSGLGVTFHSDDWRYHHRYDHHWRWRGDRDDDHGYYRNGMWFRF
ncbi:MAG: hypothetical protein JO127_03280 [Caulobacteraceae bacterium]|nr:hypothetical protein [Caulobacteraceae bacterium]